MTGCLVTLIKAYKVKAYKVIIYTYIRVYTYIWNVSRSQLVSKLEKLRVHFEMPNNWSLKSHLVSKRVFFACTEL